MAIIDPKGLFLGDRLGMCSDLAQLHWTRLYSAANNYARFELNYRKVVSAAYSSFKTPPTEAQFWGWIREYRECFLLFVYEVNEVLWGQWQTNERYLLGHKNAEDRRSPAPPAEEQEKYRQEYAALKKQRALKNHRLADLLGVVPSRTELPELTVAGVGEGVGEGKEQRQERPRKPRAVQVFTLPDWIPHLVWEAYLEMRRRKGKPPTPFALELVTKKLWGFQDQGHDVTAVLEQSIRNGWTDVYPVRDGGNYAASGGNSVNRAQQRTDGNRAAARKAAEMLGIAQPHGRDAAKQHQCGDTGDLCGSPGDIRPQAS